MMMIRVQTLLSSSRQQLLRSSTVTRSSSSLTGTVKFYLREKAYGFIQPDGGSDDLFVHRSGIVSDLDPDKYPMVPFLKKSERVRFTIERVDASGIPRAANVTWLDGSKVPPVRKNFLGGVYDQVHSRLGEATWSIMNNDALSDDEKYAAIVEASERSAERVQAAVDMIKDAGLNVEDFPTKKTQGRGRYEFETSSDEKDTATTEGTNMDATATSTEVESK